MSLPEVEEWRSIPSSVYQISSLGRVRNAKNLKIHKPEANSLGYLRASWNVDGKRKRFFVHRLVAEAFLPNPRNVSDVDHIDGDHLNNCASNLRWLTHAENNLNSKVRSDKKNCPYRNVVRCFDGWCWHITVNGQRIASQKFCTPELAWQDFQLNAPTLSPFKRLT